MPTALSGILTTCVGVLMGAPRLGLELVLPDQLFKRVHRSKARSRIFCSRCQIWAIQRKTQLIPTSQNG